MRITHEIGQWIGLTDDNGVERLRYDYASAPKPFIHPLRLPDGTTITEHEPADHIWHRGLWFAFKFVNGINYWEERDEIFGRQINNTIELGKSPSEANQIQQHLRWCDNRDDPYHLTEICHEQREISWSIEDNGLLQLKLQSQVKASKGELTLDRTPFTTWGGYGGLFVRLKNDLENPRLVFDDGTVTNRCIGERYKWGGIEGTTSNGKDCAIVFLPSSNNDRYPEPFYGAAKQDYNFFGPAPLFHEPIVLKKGETFTYQVKVLVLPRRIDAAEINTYL
jgi:hypothetical protein